MPNDFAPPNAKVDEIVEAHTTGQGVDFERMKEALKNQLAGTEQTAPVARPVPSTPQARLTTMRRFYVGNNAFELYGTSDADLQAQEDAIRGLYSGGGR
jgi:hypothetical protein